MSSLPGLAACVWNCPCVLCCALALLWRMLLKAEAEPFHKRHGQCFLFGERGGAGIRVCVNKSS